MQYSTFATSCSNNPQTSTKRGVESTNRSVLQLNHPQTSPKICLRQKEIPPREPASIQPPHLAFPSPILPVPLAVLYFAGPPLKPDARRAFPSDLLDLPRSVEIEGRLAGKSGKKLKSVERTDTGRARARIKAVYSGWSSEK